MVNGGGLGQIGDVIHNFSLAMNGREGDFRQLLTRLDDFVGVMDAQSNNLVSSIRSLDKLASTFAGQRDVISDALVKIPPALDVLIRSVRSSSPRCRNWAPSVRPPTNSPMGPGTIWCATCRFA